MPAATMFFATYRAAYAAERSTLDGSLPEERAAAVRRRAAVRVDDDLAAREARVAVRPADLEAPRGIHEEARAVQHLRREDRLDDLLDHRLGELVLLVVHRRVVLRGQHHGLHAHRLAVGRSAP
jgi:hypothetical protein